MSDTIDPHRTRFTAPLVVALGAAVAIGSGGFYAGVAVNGFTSRLQAIEQRQTDMLTKADINELKRWIPKKLEQSVATLKVSCPRFVIRGAENVICPAVPIGAVQDEP